LKHKNIEKYNQFQWNTTLKTKNNDILSLLHLSIKASEGINQGFRRRPSSRFYLSVCWSRDQIL